jgi:hypothetical protein
MAMLKTNRAQLYSQEQLEAEWTKGCGWIKQITGVSNNAAYYVLMNGIDAAKRLPAWKNYKFRGCINGALMEWKKYEATLQRSDFFDLKMIQKSVRDKIVCSNKGYYDFWFGLGGETYENTKNFVSSLAHKYKLSLDRHGVENADDISLIMCAVACLRVAERCWEDGCIAVATLIGCHISNCKLGFKPLRLPCSIGDKLELALKFVVPDYDLNPSEDRNIQLGIDEVFNRWSDQEAACNATAETVKSYEECFVDVNKVLND